MLYSMPMATITPFLQKFFWLEKHNLINTLFRVNYNIIVIIVKAVGYNLFFCLLRAPGHILYLSPAIKCERNKKLGCRKKTHTNKQYNL